MTNVNPLLAEDSLAVHMFDSGDSMFAGDYAKDNGVVANFMRTDKYLVNPAESPTEIVDRVLKPIGPVQKIHIMRMVSHGDTGLFRFPGMYFAQAISLEYRRFRSHFDPQARLELHGCGIASQSPLKSGKGTFNGDPKGEGLKYLRQAAFVFGVQVVGAIDSQYTHSNLWEYEGDTVTVFPNGQFQYDTGATRPFDVGAKETAATNWLQRIQDSFIAAGMRDVARRNLQELIAKYPNSRAAERARGKLANADLSDPPPPFHADP